jgi:hypothetical protein
MFKAQLFAAGLALVVTFAGLGNARAEWPADLEILKADCRLAATGQELKGGGMDKAIVELLQLNSFGGDTNKLPREQLFAFAQAQAIRSAAEEMVINACASVRFAQLKAKK